MNSPTTPDNLAEVCRNIAESTGHFEDSYRLVTIMPTHPDGSVMVVDNVLPSLRLSGWDVLGVVDPQEYKRLLSVVRERRAQYTRKYATSFMPLTWRYEWGPEVEARFGTGEGGITPDELRRRAEAAKLEPIPRRVRLPTERDVEWDEWVGGITWGNPKRFRKILDLA